MEHRKYLLLISVLGIFTLIISVLLLIEPYVTEKPSIERRVIRTVPTRPFDSKLWRETQVDENSSKRELLSGIKQHLHLGMTRVQAHELLGKPDMNNSPKNEDWYWLGLSPYTESFEYYILVYNENDILVSYSLDCARHQ